MARYAQLDIAGPSPIRRAIVRIFVCAFLFLDLTQAEAQLSSQLEHIRELFGQQRWQEIVSRARPEDSPDIAFYYGTALARLERWKEAESAFQIGQRIAPQDPRFPIELAGVAFKQDDYAAAEKWIHRGLRLSPYDGYANNFLATVFLLEENLEAALKYWNRTGKPQINQVSANPIPRLNPALLDRAFVFSPASTLRLPDLLTSAARLRELNSFPASRFELLADGQGDFDLVLHNIERNGCGGRWACLISVLGQTPAQTANFDYYNLRSRAINFRSLFRWDAEKRWVKAEMETPLFGEPQWHLNLDADFRNENWAVRDGFSGPSPLLGALNLKREAVKAGFTDVISGRWQWSTSTELSSRAYHDVLTGVALDSELSRSGTQLRQSFGITAALLRVPEMKLTVEATANAAVARLWSESGETYSQFEGSVRSHWFPQRAREQYEIEHAICAGKTFGSPPFDELFTLGVLGDTSLLMRAHIATRDGKKGSAPLGRNYFLSNLEATRNFAPFPLVKIKVGPFVDTGTLMDRQASRESQQWLWDVGVEARVQVLGFGVALSYGRDLRSDRNALVARPD